MSTDDFADDLSDESPGPKVQPDNADMAVVSWDAVSSTWQVTVRPNATATWWTWNAPEDGLDVLLDRIAAVLAGRTGELPGSDEPREMPEDVGVVAVGDEPGTWVVHARASGYEEWTGLHEVPTADLDTVLGIARDMITGG